MYAVIDLGGKQYKVEKGDEVVVDRVEKDAGKTMTLTPVLLGGKSKAATPRELKGARVKAKVEEHFLGDKVVVFKYKPKQGYRRKKGHRSRLSRLTIQTISTGKKAEKPAAKESAKKAEGEKKPKAGTKAKTAKKPAARKETAKKESKKAEK